MTNTIKSSIAFAILLGVAHLQPAVAQVASSVGEGAAAKALWEEVIAAKGGHEKILSITNVVVSSVGEVESKGRKYKTHVETLYAFPDRYWDWVDERPTAFGLTMSMHNFALGTKYYSAPGERFTGVLPLRSDEASNDMAGVTPELLLETKWSKPAPQSVYQLVFEGRKRVAVQTQLRKWRIDFILDEAKLPIAIISHAEDGGVVTTHLGDYSTVEGIEMPGKVSYESLAGTTTYNRSYKFNVRYDESIFLRPPSFDLGRETWKKK
jgi:hypothetical protein